MSLTATRRLRKRRLKADINVVPYIDVMLVLLIIFMVTAPLLNLGTDIQLPESQARSLSTPKEPVIVSIYADGRLALKVHDGANQEVTAEQLAQRLSALQQTNGELTVLVNGDAEASYQTIMGGIDRITAAGVGKVSLLSRPAGDP
ncbi:MAG: ExbD/TolR family protein [Pseudoxanthomonas suwonensis]|nr:ExbD/TolR family protein [Pseudoxanthomonas suwonensis]